MLTTYVGETLGIGSHMSPDISITAMPRELHGIVDLLFIRDFPEQGMPQDVGET
jgi:hypothetical protein